jgi:predicted aconitase
MPPIALSALDRELLAGAQGLAARFAARLLVRFAEAAGADRLIDAEAAHVDGCLHHGQVSLDFAEHLVRLGGRVRVPTTLNVGSVDLIHPELFRGGEGARAAGARLMRAHEELGCLPTFTCAAYQTIFRPRFGAQVAWGESNAIVFANSVLGARTERYGDFMDIACAITGRAPSVGLHTDDGRRATLVVHVDGLPEPLASSTAGLAALGHVLGVRIGNHVPAIVGLPPALSEDGLKALGAAAASSGAAALLHVVGSTPEAPSLDAAIDGPIDAIRIDADDVRRGRDELTTTAAVELGAVCLGTPHASVAELGALATAVAAHGPPKVPLYVHTSRAALTALGDVATALDDGGVRVVTDTCTYVTPILDAVSGAVMTDSAKWAWYAPGNIGVDVVFGTTDECVRSAAAGRVVRDARFWGSP